MAPTSSALPRGNPPGVAFYRTSRIPSRLYGARIHQLIHLLQRAFGHDKRVHPSVRQPVALGRGRTVGAVASGSRQPRLPQPCFRHGAAHVRSVAAVRGDGQRGAWYSELRKLVSHALTQVHR